MLKQASIKFNELNDDNFDQDLLGEYSGAGVIFGTTGGVMEASLRTAADVVSGSDLTDIEYSEVRGLDGIKEARVSLGGTRLNIAVVHGTANAAKLLEKIKSGEAKYDFVEVMACSGGCVNGGGQPRTINDTFATEYVSKFRANTLYVEDTAQAVRKAHKNTQIKKLYKDYLGEPNGDKAHELLHTKHEAKEAYPV